MASDRAGTVGKRKWSYLVSTSLCVALAAGAALAAGPARAQTVWEGDVSSDFNDPANWSAGLPTVANPGTIDSSLFPYVVAPIVDTNAFSEVLTIGNSGTGELTVRFAILDTVSEAVIGRETNSTGRVVVSGGRGSFQISISAMASAR